MPYKDPIKQKQAQHESYLRNKQKVIESAAKIRRSTRDYIRNIKETTPCAE